MAQHSNPEANDLSKLNMKYLGYISFDVNTSSNKMVPEVPGLPLAIPYLYWPVYIRFKTIMNKETLRASSHSMFFFKFTVKYKASKRVTQKH